MISRLRSLGIVLGLMGIAFVVAGGFAFFKVQEGTASLKAFSAAQGVELTYNEEGQLVDRGETEGAQTPSWRLLTDDWELPGRGLASSIRADPIVNTASEYMYQMATVAYHTLHGDADGSAGRGGRVQRRDVRRRHRTRSRSTAGTGRT